MDVLFGQCARCGGPLLNGHRCLDVEFEASQELLQVVKDACDRATIPPQLIVPLESNVTQETHMSTSLPATSVAMADGRTVVFPAKRKIVKEALYGNGQAPTVRLDFRNGQTLSFGLNVPPNLSEIALRLALHGALEVLDSSAEEVEDQVEGVEARITRLAKGEWPTRGNGDDMAGASVLLRALVERTGKPAETVRAFLQGKTLKQKLELRKDPSVAPIVERLEAARRAKTTGVDTSALLAELT